jgi:DNA-binding NtrC family response regulator
MDRTLVTPTRLEVRGGTFTLVEPDDDASPLPVGAEPRIIGRRPGCHLVLHDAKVSATHCEVVATDSGVRLRDLGSSNGTYVGELRIVEALLSKPCTVRCGDTRIEFRPGRSVERVAISKSERFGPLVGSTPVMRALFEKLRTLAPTTVSVLVEGETGTGKELVAQALHEKSQRSDKPFVIVDCAAIPHGLAESMLFGHEKGAFTGATSRRVSPFVEAHGGTLFLDEIGELPLEIQPKLLRVLAEQRVQSVGGTGYVPFDVRIVAATRRELLAEINRRAFRDDLYFRVAQARVTVPPLRDRKDDLGPLVQRLLEVSGHAKAYERVTPESLDRLDRHDWPGNVRELRSLVAVALAFDDGDAIDLAAHIGDRAPVKESRARGRGSRSAARPDLSYRESKEEHDRVFFTALYQATKGNMSAIARRAKIDRETVGVYLKAHGIGTQRR